MSEDNINNYFNKYLETNEHIKKINIKLKELKEIQKKRETNILNIIQKDNSNYEYNGFKFKTKESKIKEGITLKYLENILNIYFKHNSDKTQQLIDYINDNRKIETKIILDIKK